jgi:ribosomal protein S18 acetylase RimI-like enzyme
MVDGVPVGRVWTAFVPGACVVVDLAFLPEHRRRGLGTQVLGEVVAEADRRGVPVRVTVERTNVPVRALNARFGFVETGGDEIHLRMERPVPGRSASG